MLKAMVSVCPVLALASRIAWRKLPAPLSFVFATVKVCTAGHCRSKTDTVPSLLAVALLISCGIIPMHFMSFSMRPGRRKFGARLLMGARNKKPMSWWISSIANGSPT